MALNLITGSNRSIYISMFVMFLTAGLSACQEIPEENASQNKSLGEVNVGIFYSPKGAVAPDLLDEITSETTPDEVLKILGARYAHIEAPWLDTLEPVADGFFYKENGQTKYIDVWYANGRVDFVRYGYQESLNIQ